MIILLPKPDRPCSICGLGKLSTHYREQKHMAKWESSPSLDWPDTFVSYKGWSPLPYKKKKRNSINKNTLCIIQERAKVYGIILHIHIFFIAYLAIIGT